MSGDAGGSYRVRPSHRDDARALAHLFREPSIVANTYRGGDATTDGALAFLKTAESPDVRQFVAEADGGELAGFVGIRRHDAAPARHAAEFLVVVSEGWRNRGVGRTLVERVLDVAFSEWGLERVELEVVADNAAAVHLYERLGFRHEGVKRAAFKRDGRLVDAAVMGLLRGEWAPRRGA